MDKLEKALVKANNKKHQARPTTRKTGGAEINVNYSQTKKYALNYATLRQRRIVAQDNHGIETETFSLLRTKILKQLRDNNWNSFGITAPGQGAGKSMISVNLAIAIAKEVNQTVLLVDLDLRFPKLHWYFDINPKQGLRDYLLSDISLNEILINPDFERLVLLPGQGQTIGGSSELLSAPKMQMMVAEIKQRYQSRIIIFDLPPVLVVDDVLACVDYFDAVLLVVEEGKTKPEDITKSLHLLSCTHLLGTVLNKAEYLPDHPGYY